jgi:hypothetical protein
VRPNDVVPLIKKSNFKSKTAIITILVLMFIASGFFAYMKTTNTDIRNISVGQFFTNLFSFNASNISKLNASEIQYDVREHPAFTSSNGLVIKCSKERIQALDKKGAMQWNIPLNTNNPMVKAAGPYVLAVDIGGNDIYVIKGKDVKWSSKVKDSIINADISEDGYVTLVTEVKGYKGCVTVFDLQGNEMFTRFIPEDFVLSAKVLPGGSQVVINRLGTAGVKTNTNLEYTDMEGKTIASIKKDDMIFPSLWPIDSKSILAVSSDSAMFIDADKSEKWSLKFTNRKIFSSNVAAGKYAVLALSGEDKSGIFNNFESEIKIYNFKGAETASYKLNEKVNNIKTYGDVISANTDRVVHFINTSGRFLGKYTSNSNITGVYFLNRHDAAVVTVNKIMIVKVG